MEGVASPARARRSTGHTAGASRLVAALCGNRCRSCESDTCTSPPHANFELVFSAFRGCRSFWWSGGCCYGVQHPESSGLLQVVHGNPTPCLASSSQSQRFLVFSQLPFSQKPLCSASSGADLISVGLPDARTQSKERAV
ncbi:hypothetical protein OPV22_018889 [Ensete ventricosum]|uniref:Uncharacterized protein n=1 Tax=Ensete ventricosum TaxID=4639 RepID=A0AAV8R594_ENSVE|nr:hypothetical protein OPV22_018889 [Ensete ventricosum]